MSPTNRILLYFAAGSFPLLLTPLVYSQVIVAHRGASYDAPENTMSAFRLAWKLGADAIEGDFHLTSDGQIVCLHDRTTKRVSNQDLTVADSTLEQLKQLDVGAWKGDQFRDEGVATLADVLGCVPKGKRLFIEVKCGPEVIPALVAAIHNAELEPDQLRIIAFDKEVIREVKQALPDHEAYWLVSFKEKSPHSWTPTCEEVIAIAGEIKADGVDLQGKLEVVNRDFLTACHAAGMSTHVWTIDDPKTAQTYVDFGVSSVTTNRPDLIRAALSQ